VIYTCVTSAHTVTTLSNWSYNQLYDRSYNWLYNWSYNQWYNQLYNWSYNQLYDQLYDRSYNWSYNWLYDQLYNRLQSVFAARSDVVVSQQLTRCRWRL